MTEREKIIKIIADNGECFPDIKKCAECKYKNAEEDCRPFCTMYKTADAILEAGYGDVTEWKEKVECAKRILQIPTLPNGTTDLSYFEYKGERIQDIARQRDEYRHRSEVAEKERDEWKERAERMHKEALKQKQLVSDSKHREDALRNQLECAMDMVSEMEHAKRTLKILYMSGAITEEALGDAVKQAKREIEEEGKDE